MRKVELLAPAGDLEKLKIAVLYGADAVFVGSKEFSLRSRASNFTVNDLKEGAKFCHEHNAKLYVTTNIVPHNQDLIGLIDYLEELEEAGVDAIICSSYAVMYIAKRYTNLEIHVSTQQSLTNSLGVKFYEDFGATRVVLAREMSIEQIKNIKENTNVELEVFIHGGMCSSYSGRCMLSNHMTNRDANRGGCAHSCRWNYHLMMGDLMLSDEEKFQFSSKDLMAIRQIPDLLECADSLKIEGRMKSIHYIATVTKVYRMLIDDYYEKGRIDDFTYYEQEIKKAENRLFSHGFLLGETTVNEQLYNMRSENPTQDFVGIILSYDKETKKAKVDVRNHFKPYSVLEAFGPNLRSTSFEIGKIINEKGEEDDAARHPREVVEIDCPFELKPYDMLRLVACKK